MYYEGGLKHYNKQPYQEHQFHFFYYIHRNTMTVKKLHCLLG